jgi:hypothetical protein
MAQGPEVGDAHVQIHAETGPVFRRELNAGARAAAASFSDEFNNRLNVSLLGRLKGSRNNFLNVVGTIAQSIENLVGRTISGAFQGLGGLIGNLGSRFSDASGPIGAFGRALENVGARVQGLGTGGLDGLIIQVAGMAIAFQAIVQIAGVAAAGLSLLAGAFTALTISIGGGLLGGLVLLGPLIAGLVAGIGALTLAFTGLTTEEQEALDPLKELLQELQDAVQSRIVPGLEGQLDRLKAVLSPLGDVLGDTAQAASEWLDRMLDAFDPSGPLGASLEVLQGSLPSIFTGLLDLLGGLTSSLVGLFAAASPVAERFLEHINGVVSQFSAWVNSAEGQETINAFLTEALGVLGNLWDIAKELGTTLAILFDTGANTGDTFLQKIKEILASFNEWLGSEEGRIALSNWFADSVTAITLVGVVLDQLIKLFDELDNPQTRLAFQFLLLSLGALINIINVVQGFINDLVNNIISGLARAEGPITNTGEFVKRVQLAFANLQTGAANAINSIVSFFAGLPGQISAAVGAMGTLLYSAGVNVITGLRNGITAAFNNMIEYIRGLAARIATAFRSALGIASPSKVFREYGINIGEGLALGIDDSLTGVDRSLNNLIDTSMLSNLNSPVSALATQGSATTAGTDTATGSVIQAGAITVVSPYANPMLVAVEVMDALAVRGK